MSLETKMFKANKKATFSIVVLLKMHVLDTRPLRMIN